MEIISKKTRSKGFTIKFIFDNEEEYLFLMKIMEEILNKLSDEDKNKYTDITELFKNYYTEKDPYSENKPTVIVYENHILTIASAIWLLCDINNAMLQEKVSYLEEQKKLLSELLILKICLLYMGLLVSLFLLLV